MGERIIPIQIESDEESQEVVTRESNSDNDAQQSSLSKSLEELSVDTKRPSTVAKRRPSNSEKQKQAKSSESQNSLPGPSTTKVRVKPAPPPGRDEQEYLKRFDVLEKRDGNTALSGYTLPNSDCPERIVLVIDRAQDDDYTPFIIGSQKYTPLSMIKRAISIFIKLKSGINPLHEFAIIVMNENQASLLRDFTSDVKKLTDCLNKITECQTEDIFDLNTIFDIIEEVPLPKPPGPGVPPLYILRTIIFYARSYTMPQLELTEKLQEYLTSPFFVCDILITHEPIEGSNHCKKIFNLLQQVDQKGLSYFFPVGRDARRINQCGGRLLGHPLQRPIQKLIKN